MEIYENLDSELKVIDSTAIGGKICVIDVETEEVGRVISKASNEKLVVHWKGAEESETHSELELISTNSPNVTIIKLNETSGLEIKKGRQIKLEETIRNPEPRHRRFVKN
jgi:hypothetical protein